MLTIQVSLSRKEAKEKLGRTVVGKEKLRKTMKRSHTRTFMSAPTLQTKLIFASFKQKLEQHSLMISNPLSELASLIRYVPKFWVPFFLFALYLHFVEGRKILDAILTAYELWRYRRMKSCEKATTKRLGSVSTQFLSLSHLDIGGSVDFEHLLTANFSIIFNRKLRGILC